MHISIWEQESFFAPQDVIIIGGGLTGLWCAYELLQKNNSLRLLILDSGIIPSGASTRNAGFACFGSPTELLSDAIKMGEERMWQLIEMRYKGIRKIRKVFGDKVIDYDACGGYECLRNDINNIADIEDSLSWLNDGMKAITNNKTTFARTSEKLVRFGFQGFDALIENKYEGNLHSGKLVMALQNEIRSLGGQILQGVEAEGWEENEVSITVFTKQNLKCKATSLFICTNALSPDLLCDDSVIAARGQIIVTEPVDGLKIRGAFHFDQGFYYFRNVGNRVLLGGARNQAFEKERTTKFGITETIQQTLEAFLARHLLPKQSVKIDYRWSGIMGFTDDKQPLIKQLSNRITAIVLCNGMGVALAPVIAEEINL